MEKKTTGNTNEISALEIAHDSSLIAVADTINRLSCDFVVRNQQNYDDWYMRIDAEGRLSFNPRYIDNQEDLIKNICTAIEKSFNLPKKECYCISLTLCAGFTRQRGYVFANSEEEAIQKVTDHYQKKNFSIKEIIKCEAAKESQTDFYISFFIR
jgi:hypothetical protein